MNANKDATPKKTIAIPRTVWALGLVSLLMDVSSETVHGLLPVFLVSVLGASFTTVGFIEGIGEATALVVKVLSGPLSDHWGKRKPFVFLGYGIGALSKPLFAIASTPAMVFTARVFDRAGKGIRGAPRDALIADVTPMEIRGEAFGLRQTLDTVGAFIGPLLAIGLMSAFNDNYRLVFWLAAIPGFIAVMVIVFGVREPDTKDRGSRRALSFSSLRDFPALFWIVSAAGALLQLARFSEAFLILRAKDLGLALGLAPAVLVAMNIVYAVSAYPIGWLSDRIHRDRLLLFGFSILIVADVALALAHGLPVAFLGIVLWGLHMGLTQGTLAALVADHSPSDLRGTAFGVFNLLSAAALLAASAIAGILWDRYGPSTTFTMSGVFSAFGLVALAGLQWRARKEED